MCNNIFSVKIKELRTSNKLTQSEFGKIVGLSKQTINDIEHGRATTTALKIIEIAKAFNVSADYILGLSEAKQQSSEDDDESELLSIFRKLDDFSKGFMLENARILLEKHPLRMDKTK
ncbi:MAG: transcriptional regulator [Neobacillus sp.]|jgi:transcriptional regulator with XRE-family HTH domain|nr:transcriptional regulator [Neobacillus sp.]